MSDEKATGLDLLRKPFGAHQIGKLPKPTKRQTDEVKADYKKGIRCKLCGAWHHPDVVHLDYVGHAALTDRLLDCDPEWNWEPTAWTDGGQPARDENGGMWIKLTVCGVTRLGYGDASGKKGGDANKELIGDALRNAAMRFGAALDLWHKGDLHISDDHDEVVEKAHQNEGLPKAENSNAEKDPKQLAYEAGERLKSCMDSIKDVSACNIEAFSKANEADWGLLSEKGRAFLSERMANKRGLLSQAPSQSEYGDLEGIRY